MNMRKRLNTEEFIERAQKVHGDKYDYSKTDIESSKDAKVLIVCPMHGEFRQRYLHHLRGEGCKKCATSRFKKKVFGAGINDVYLSADNLYVYQRWTRLLRRCYDPKYTNRFPTYQQCSVCDEWLVFSNFKAWFDDNYIEGYEIDKDIIGGNSKVYSPETCCFVPQEINKLLIKADSRRGQYPIGVSYHKKKNKYRVCLAHKSKILHIGYFNTVEEAFNAYKADKEAYIKAIAKEYYVQGKISKQVFEALLNYKVKISD